MKIKLQQLNLTYVLDIDGTEWLFIPSKEEYKECETTHNGCCCLSDKISRGPYFEPYFNPQSGHVTSDFEIECIRPANDDEIDSFIDVMDFFNYTLNENNKLEKIK